MKYLALTLPGGYTIDSPVDTGPGSSIPEASLGGFLTGAFNVVIFGAGFLMFFWLLWGVFEYIFAGGDKEKLGKARSRIIWALVGFIFILIAFALQQFLQEIFPQDLPGGITPVSTPGP